MQFCRTAKLQRTGGGKNGFYRLSLLSRRLKFSGWKTRIAILPKKSGRGCGRKGRLHRYVSFCPSTVRTAPDGNSASRMERRVHSGWSVIYARTCMPRTFGAARHVRSYGDKKKLPIKTGSLLFNPKNQGLYEDLNFKLDGETQKFVGFESRLFLY